MKLSDITPKGWLYIGIFILVVVLLVMYVKNKNKNTITTTTTVLPPANVNPNPVQSNTGSGNSFPLSYGSSGSNVSKWQTYLNSLGSKLTVDGKWGPLTEAASLSKTGYNSITEVYFNSVVK